MRILGLVFAFVLLTVSFGCSNTTLKEASADNLPKNNVSGNLVPVYETELSAKSELPFVALRELRVLTDEHLAPITPLAPMVNRFKKSYPALIQRFKEQGTAEYTGTVHVILNRHKQPVGEDTDPAELQASQAQVLHLLDQIKPDLLVAEGCTETMKDDICAAVDWDQNRRIAEFVKRSPPDRNSFIAKSAAGKRLHGIYQYHEAHPEVPTIGMEHEDLLEMNMMIFHGLMSVAPEQYYIIDKASIMARSEFGLTKLVEASRKIGAKNPAIVIGAYHGSDLASLCHYWGLKAKFYIAAPPGQEQEYIEMMLPKY